MKKDTIRDYATEAFRYYAACGCKTSEQIKQELYDKIYERSKKEYHTITKGTAESSVEYAAMAAEKALETHLAEFMDIIAVEKTLMDIGNYGRQAVSIVYFEEPEKDLERNDISDRVHKAEIAIHACDRQIYRWLKKARETFAKHRGLRIS